MNRNNARRTLSGALGACLVVAVATLSPIGAAAADTTDPAGTTQGAPERAILTATADPASSQRVTWRAIDVPTDTPASVELRLVDGTVRTVDAAVTKVVHIGANNRVTNDPNAAAKTAVTFAAELTGLEPGTSYAYRVLNSGQAGEWNTFTTASANDDPFTFTWYSDGQNDLTEYWTPIVDFTNAAIPNSRLTLQSGDLINLSVENEWQEWFDITSDTRQTQNWLPAIGNHEYSQDAGSDLWDSSYALNNGDGPQPDPAASASLREYQALIAAHQANRVYYTDFQGVRFIQLNSHLVGQAAMQNQQGVTLPSIPSAEFNQINVALQAQWLDRVLEESDANWTVVMFHHPTFSTSQGRNQPVQRGAWLPIIEKHNVDLVLSGHDHTYARGYLDSDVVEPGVTSGPVFAVSNSGPKHYNLATDATNVWTANGATQAVKYQHVSLVQGIRVTPTVLEYEAVIAQRDGLLGSGSNPNTDLQVGDTGDAFTIVRHADGSKSVTEGIQRRVATGLGDAGNGDEGDLIIEAEIPDLGAGALTLSVTNAGEPVSLGEGVNNGDRWAFAAELPAIGVTDTRREAAGWSVSASFNDLTGPVGTIESSHLGWTPRVLDAATAIAGKPVAGILAGGEGLVGARLLGSADDHARFGTTRLVADLTLEAPISVRQGTYSGAVHVSLFPVD